MARRAAQRPRKTMERYGGSRAQRAPIRKAQADVDRGVQDTSRAQRRPVPPSRRAR